MRKVTTQDMHSFTWPNQPKFCPNGERIIYEKTVVDKEANGYITHLWLSQKSGEAPQQLTKEGTRNLSAAWSPTDNAIAYVSNREKGMQVWLYDFATDKHTRLTNVHENVSQVQFSPDGKTVYALLPIKDAIREWDEATSEQEHMNAPSERTYDSLYYKFDGIGFSTGTKKQLIAIDLNEKTTTVITDGTVNIEDYTISPDGETITFSTIDFYDENPLFNGELYQITATGENLTKIYDQTKAANPSYSPDGQWIAFIEGDVHQDLYIYATETGEVKQLSQNYPGTFADMIYTDSMNYKMPWQPVWSQDSEHVYVLSGYQGANEIVQFSVDSTADPVTVIGGARDINHFTYDGKNHFAITYASPETPGRVSLIDIADEAGQVRKTRDYTDPITFSEELFPANETYLDDCNADLFANITVVPPESFNYESTDGWNIHGFMIKPANMEAGKKYPVVLDIHGGPHSTHGYTYFHQLQLYSAAGYGVVYVNPRGSSGYGETFTEAVIGEYGTKDMDDILNGLDAALAKYDFLDKDRVAVSGLSYGGFMTNWIVTHTDRFQVAISEGGISNWVSMHGTSDISPGFIEREFAGKTSIDQLWEVSPLAYIENINTPILIVHAEDDIRVPVEQSEQLFSFVKRQGKTARFVRIPECTHVMLQNGAPDKKLARLEAMLDWLQQYLPTEV